MGSLYRRFIDFCLRHTQLVGIALAVIGAASASTKGIAIKLALAEGVDITTTMAWRMIIAVPAFVVIGFLGYRRIRRTRPADISALLTGRNIFLAMVLGLISTYAAAYMDFAALNYISAQLDRLVLLTYPFFVVLIGAVLFHRRLTVLIIASLIVSYVGIATIFLHDMRTEGQNVVLGTSLVLGAAVLYALFQLFAKSMIDRMGSGLFNSIAMCAAGPAVVVHFLLTHAPQEIAVPMSAMPYMVAVGVFATVLPSYCIASAIGMIGSERTAVIGNVSPIITIALAIVVLGEAFTIYHAIGAALVCIGVLLFRQKAKPKVASGDIEP